MSRSFLRALAVAGALFTAACGGDGATGPKSANVVGTWGLHTVNGTQLPYTLLVNGADKIELVSDSYTLSTGDNFTETAIVRYTESGVVTVDTVSDDGKYTLAGSALSLKYNSDLSVSQAAVNGDTFTMATSGVTLVYRRQ